MANLHFETLVAADKSAHDAVLDALIAYNTKIVGKSGKTEITFHVKDETGTLVGGANGFTHWNYFFVAHLWVSDKTRGQGVGTQIMRNIEREALSRSCTHCWLDTFSFQAANFYEKLGYKKFGELEDYPKGHKRMFFSRKLV